MKSSDQLLRLARLYRVQQSFQDGFRRERRPSVETLLAVLRSLGARVSRPGDAAREIRRIQRRRWDRLLEPVCTIWHGRPGRCLLRMPCSAASTPLEARLETEQGVVSEWPVLPESLRLRSSAVVAGAQFRCLELPLPDSLPLGYHRLVVRAAGSSSRALVIHAPPRCPDMARSWGVFAPLYALHSCRSGGLGTFADLGSLVSWVGDLGGGYVGTLPLLAAFLDEPFAPSPYTPVSRCFWNELFVDLPSLPEWSPDLGGIVNGGGRYVDYRLEMRAKRGALERALAGISDMRRADLLDYLDAAPELRRYAAYRAGIERGLADPPGFDIADPQCAYHAYAQWIAEAQVAQVAGEAADMGSGLYLDLPLGVHPRGFDRHRFAGIFAAKMAGGAPPDRFFSKGQNWGFAPLDPRKARARGHDYFIACLRHNMRHARALRIDHVMGLHRMYWIPEGLDGDEGAYVHWPADELYAIVCLEATRSDTAIVGEDLGTVPGYVRRRMAERGLRGMHVAQFSVRSKVPAGVSTPARASVASVNTHDTATFAAFWTGKDIEDQAALGLLSPEHAIEARAKRRQARNRLLEQFRRCGLIDGDRPTVEDLLGACLDLLAASHAECVMVTLEDLLGETEPQNTPGTDTERPNWKRRARKSLQEILRDPSVAAVLSRVSRARRS